MSIVPLKLALNRWGMTSLNTHWKCRWGQQITLKLLGLFTISNDADVFKFIAEITDTSSMVNYFPVQQKEATDAPLWPAPFLDLAPSSLDWPPSLLGRPSPIFHGGERKYNFRCTAVHEVHLIFKVDLKRRKELAPVKLLFEFLKEQ
jgi:hypothetical protein